jgi:hypothetical protein
MVKVKKAPSDGLRAALAQLAQAEAVLVANQAAFVAQQGEFTREIALARKDTEALRRESAERFQHIESLLLRLLEVIPDALREKIGLQKK